VTKWLAALLALLIHSGGAAAEPAPGTLTVIVKGLEDDAGTVVIALLDSAESYDSEDGAFRSASPNPAEGRAQASFGEVPGGTYAVKVIHDRNSNGKLDTNLFGLPKEPFGFSNDAMGRFGPPGFDAASFTFDGSELTIEISATSL